MRSTRHYKPIQKVTLYVPRPSPEPPTATPAVPVVFTRDDLAKIARQGTQLMFLRGAATVLAQATVELTGASSRLQHYINLCNASETYAAEHCAAGHLTNARYAAGFTKYCKAVKEMKGMLACFDNGPDVDDDAAADNLSRSMNRMDLEGE